MGHDDFSTNEYFAAAVAQAQGDIPGVTSMQGTRVEPLERETDANGEKSETNAELHKSFKELNKKAKNLSKDMDESIARFEALLAKARGEDTQATEEQQVDAWANLLSQEQGLLNQEDTVATKAEVEAFKKQQKEYMDNLAQETKRASVSPSMARTRMPDPIAPLGPYSTRKAFPSPLESSIPFVSDYQDAGMPNVTLPIDYAGIPTQPNVSFDRLSPGEQQRMEDAVPAFTSPLSPEGALGSTDFPPGSTPINKDSWIDKDGKITIRITEGKDTKPSKKSKYGTWDGLLNKKTAKQNLEAQKTFKGAWMSDFIAKFGQPTFSFTRPIVNGKKLSYKDNALRNDVMNTDEFRSAYAAVYGENAALKMVGNALSFPVGFFGSGLQKMVNKKGLGNADKFNDTVKKVEDGEYEHQGDGSQQSASEQAKEGATGGFWGLMAFAKKNPKIFGPLSGDELWALVSDPDGFWEFYEAALAGT